MEPACRGNVDPKQEKAEPQLAEGQSGAEAEVKRPPPEPRSTPIKSVPAK